MSGSRRLSEGLAALAHLNTPSPRPVTPRAPVAAPSSMTWTPAQVALLEDESPRLLVSALAGTGKTSTLLEYARRRPHLKWTLAVLNKALAERLARLVPPNVKVTTLHALAYAQHGQRLVHKLTDAGPSPADLRAALRRHAPDVLSQDDEALLTALRVALDAFCMSADVSPGVRHVPLFIRADPTFEVSRFLAGVSALWSASLDPSDPLPVGHDVYLKRFCQSEAPWPGAAWLLDEAQDWPEAVLDAAHRCTRRLVRAGDPFQRLLAFRGAATHAWRHPQETEHRLDHSFRAGQDLAPWVNAPLGRLQAGVPLPQVWTGTLILSTQVVLRDGMSPDDEVTAATGADLVLADRWSALAAFARACKAAGRPFRWPDNAPQHRLPAAPVVKPGEAAGPLLATVHAAKGTEASQVWVLGAPWRARSPAALQRLMYVAVSRAQHTLSLPAWWPRPDVQGSETRAFLAFTTDSAATGFEDCDDPFDWGDSA